MLFVLLCLLKFCTICNLSPQAQLLLGIVYFCQQICLIAGFVTARARDGKILDVAALGAAVGGRGVESELTS